MVTNQDHAVTWCSLSLEALWDWIVASRNRLAEQIIQCLVAGFHFSVLGLKASRGYLGGG